MSGLYFRANTRSDSGKAKSDLQQLAKLTAVKQVIAAGGADLQRSTMRNMTQKYTGHMEGNRHVMPTGTTKRSVKLGIEDGGMTAHVTVGTEYFGYLEVGTRYMRARPTLKPAFDATRSKVATRLSKIERV